MTIPSSIKQGALALFFTLILMGMSTLQLSAQGQQTVWLACTFDTSSVWKGKDGRDKFERRFYVSNLVSVSKDDYLAADSTGDRIEGVCGDYLDKTVNKAATSRGEHLDTTGQLKIIRNIELSGEDAGGPNPYNFAPKSEVEKKLADDIKEMKDANRVIYNFNWDPTGKNEATDLDNEMKRTGPTLAPKSNQAAGGKTSR